MDSEKTIARMKWKVGDRVCFAHDTRTAYRVSRLVPNEPMLELDGMPGQFGDHIFVEPPTPSDVEEKQEVLVQGEPANENAGPAICPICSEPMSVHGYRNMLTAGKNPKREVCPPGAIERAAATSNTNKKQEDSAADSIDLPSATRKLAERIVNSLGEHSLHVAIPVDVAQFIHGVMLGVQSRIAEKKKPYSTPELTGPFSHSDLEILKGEAARAEPPVKDLAEKMLSMISLADSGRCMACGWTITDRTSDCVAGNCSFRPDEHYFNPDTAAHAALWRERTRILELARKHRGGGLGAL